jgi:hypothetical protein
MKPIRRMGSRGLTALAVLAAATACQGARPPGSAGDGARVEGKTMEVEVGFSTEPRQAEARSQLPAAIQPLLPRRGIYAAGGGLVSSAWRVVLTLEGELTAGRAPGSNAPSTGKLTDERSRMVAGADLAAIFALADRVWREKRGPNLSPTADYDEIIAIVDGDEAYFLEGFGPIRGGAAAELIARLRELAGI